MFLGGAASLWGPIVGAIAYVWVDDVTRKAGTDKEGAVGWLFGWANQSPATMILAAVIIVVVVSRGRRRASGGGSTGTPAR